ncbi:methyltransferase regulatory domain-containing protein [Campylobacter sp. M4]|uniref:methyltransferase regulatory domain-containing protein n=1 Tax=Campylobacter sp. M4 TaxID=3424761 RepID=UPI003D34E232
MRQIMLQAASGANNQIEKVKKAKEALEVYKKFLIECKNETIPADQLIHFINNTLLNSESYIAHEFLDPINQPFYFREFADMLEKRQLSYLCESNLDDIFAPGLDNEGAMSFMQENMSHRYDQEQFMDFFSNKTFRTSLIVHKEAYDSVHGREIGPNDFAKLNIVADFKLYDGKWVSKDHIAVKDSTAWLSDVFSRIYPQSASLPQILELLEPEKKLSAYAALIDIVSLGDTNFTVREFESISYEVGKTRLKPEYAKYIKYFLHSSDNLISFANCLNKNMQFSKADCYLALKFDGVNTLAQIVDEYLKFIKKNDVKIVSKDNKELKGEKLKKHAMLAVAQLEFMLKEAYFLEEYIS